MIRSAWTAAAAALLVAAPAAAKETEILITPYLLIPNLNGKTGIGPYVASVDLTPVDIFSQLNWGIMGSAEINNGSWGAKVDAIYSNLDASDDSTRNFSINARQGLYSFRLQRNLSDGFWVYAGARVNVLRVGLGCNNLSCDATLPPAVTERDLSSNQTWVDPIVGFQLDRNFSDKVRFLFEADIGGFGAGSDIAVNVWPQIGFRVGRSGTALIGYRIIYVDYKTNVGSVDRLNPEFVWDMNMFGPTLGYQFRF